MQLSLMDSDKTEVRQEEHNNCQSAMVEEAFIESSRQVGLGFEKTAEDGEMIHDGGRWVRFKAPALTIDCTMVGMTMPTLMTMEGEKGDEI